jgi:hypothetical protein
MAPFLPIRAASRSQAVRIGGQTVKQGKTTYVDLAAATETGGHLAGSSRPYSPYKELQNHLAIGAIFVVGPLTQTASDWAVKNGVVTTATLEGTEEEAKGEFAVATTAGAVQQRSTSAEVEVEALSVTKKKSAASGKERIDIITASTTTKGAAKYTAGTAAVTGKAVVPKTTKELEEAHELLVAEVVFTESKTAVTVRNVNRA